LYANSVSPTTGWTTKSAQLTRRGQGCASRGRNSYGGRAALWRRALIAINGPFGPGELKLASLNPDFNAAINGRSSTDFYAAINGRSSTVIPIERIVLILHGRG